MTKISGQITEENIYEKIRELIEFSHVCSERHSKHTDNEKLHENKHDQYESLIKNVIATQSTITDTQKCMSESLQVFSKFIEKHEPNFDIVSNFIGTLGSIKAAILWLAAVIGGLGIIIGGLVATWVYVSSPIPITEIIDKF